MECLADLSHLEKMMDYVRKEAASAGMAEKAIYKMELACEEAIVNVISYAYPEKKGNIQLNCEKKGHRFEIMVRDQGIAFNPIDAEVQPQLNEPVEARRIGGLGIFLLRKIIDEAIYQRLGNENILRLSFIVD